MLSAAKRINQGWNWRSCPHTRTASRAMQTQLRDIHISIVADSELHSFDQLREHIGLDADSSWNMGDSRGPAAAGLKHRFSRWSIDDHARDSIELDAALDRLFARIDKVEHRLRSLPDSVRRALVFMVTESNSVFGFGVAQGHVRRAAAIGAEIDMSVVVSMPKA